jgi:hypothetical protein
MFWKSREMIDTIFNNIQALDTSIMQTIGIALLTILISTAIAIFQDKKEFEDLDRHVILKVIVKARCLLVYVAFIFAPLLLWEVSPCWLRFIEFIIWIFGIGCIARILIKSYHWLVGRKFELRFRYLQGLKDPEGMEEPWRSVWQTQKINLQNEIEFFKIFSDITDQLMNFNE